MKKERLLLLVSLVIYLICPLKYSYPLCLLGLCFFIVLFYFTLRASHYTIASFNVIFSLGFLGVTYLYPVFVYPVYPNFAFFSIGNVNDDVITKATMLATLAYSFYASFYVHALKKYPIVNSCSTYGIVDKKYIKGILLTLIIVYFGFIVIGGLDIYRADYSGQSVVVNPKASFVYVFLISYMLFACIANRNINNKFLYFFIVLLMIPIILTGSRTLPLRVMSILFVLFVDKLKLSKKKILLLISIGFILMSFVGESRSSSKIDQGDLGIVASAVDLIVCSRAYYELYDYVITRGITYGISFTANILAVIPFAQSAFSNIFGISDLDMRSDTFATKLVLGDTSAGLGLGTHLVGDTYLASGLIGTILLFSLLGYYIVKLRFYTYRYNNWKATVVYFTMISCAVFMTRNSYFLGLKDIVWILCITHIYRTVLPNLSSTRKMKCA